MAVSVPNGALVSLAASYGSPTNITAISNASTAVCSATGHAFVTGDIVEVTSGWSRLTNKAVRVGTVVAGVSFELEGINTVSTSIYPALGGVGSARKVASFTQLSQILSSTSSGGDQQFLDYQFLEADAQKRIPTFKNAAGIAFSVGDDATQAGYILASTANDDRLARVAKITLPTGAVILYNAYISLNKTPSMTVNELMACQVTLSLLAEVVRYAS
jgi:hypothetical protein